MSKEEINIKMEETFVFPHVRYEIHNNKRLIHHISI